MTIYILQRGLVVQIGQRHFEYKRELENKKIQLEDVLTGAIRSMPAHTLVHKIQEGEIKIVRESEPIASKFGRDDMWAAVLIDKMDAKNQAEYLRRVAYVRAMRKRGLTRGRRSQIKEAIHSVAKGLDDLKPPSASAVMRWMRRFEELDLQPAALASGHLLRSSQRRLDQLLVDCIREQLAAHYLKRGGRSIRYVLIRIRQIQQGMAARGEIDASTMPVSESTVRRLANEITPYDRDRLRYGNTYAAAKWRHSVGGIYATRPLERVEMDHTLRALFGTSYRLSLIHI